MPFCLSKASLEVKYMGDKSYMEGIRASKKEGSPRCQETMFRKEIKGKVMLF